MNTYEARREMPKYTCPDIDGIIAALEDLRLSNAALREIAEDALNFADKETERADSAERDAEALRNRVDELEQELAEVNEG